MKYLSHFIQLTYREKSFTVSSVTQQTGFIFQLERERESERQTQRKRDMEKKLTALSHLFVTVFLSGFASLIVVPAITDVTMFALCPGTDECSLAIYLSGFQQAVRFSS